MTDEFYFFSNDCNNWNYNPFIERERERFANVRALAFA